MEPAVSLSVSVGDAGVPGVPIGWKPSDIRPAPMVKPMRSLTRNVYTRWLSNPVKVAWDVLGDWVSPDDERTMYTASPPPLSITGFQSIVRVPSPRATSWIRPVRSMGLSGTTPADHPLHSENPMGLWARTWNLYVCPFSRPVMSHEVPWQRWVRPRWSCTS